MTSGPCLLQGVAATPLKPECDGSGPTYALVGQRREAHHYLGSPQFPSKQSQYLGPTAGLWWIKQSKHVTTEAPLKGHGRTLNRTLWI